MFEAIMIRMRYFGGGFGRMPRARRTRRLMKPRGLVKPSISASSAWSVPSAMPPPPNPAMKPVRRPAGGAGWELLIAEENNSHCVPGDTYARPLHMGLDHGSSGANVPG